MLHKGRQNLCSFWNERVAGVGRQNLHNFLDEQVGLQGGQADKNCTVFGRNWLEAWQSKLCNSSRELPVGYWVTGNRNYEIPKGKRQ